MGNKADETLARAIQEVLEIVEKLKGEEPELAGSVINEEIIRNLMLTGMSMQFDTNHQKLKQNIRMHLRKSLRID